MAASTQNRETTYGFLSIAQIDGLGFCGGLLVLNSRGRPIEFHCTAPVAANRAQQILYGQTLKEFVCCDQIGVSLIAKVKTGLDVILVDERPFLSLAQLSQIPVVFVGDDEVEFSEQSVGEQSVGDQAIILEIGGQHLEISGGQRDRIETTLRQFTVNLPMTEPFERIRLAISEAHAEAA